jgi:2-polyprenyl-3-methyl-5-hydroxy-6-metoxy-1,4-benzoquinol methylase
MIARQWQQEDRSQNMERLYAGNPDYREKWARTQDDGFRAEEERLVKQYCKRLGGSVLNIGCGAGRESFAFYRAGFRTICGLDCTEALLSMARETACEKGMKIDFRLGSAVSLPFAPGQIDYVTVFENVLGHITPRSERRKVFAECARVLKSDALLFIIANEVQYPSRDWFCIRLLDILRWVHNPAQLEAGDVPMNGSSSRISPHHSDPVSHWFSPDEIGSDAARANLSTVEVAQLSWRQRIAHANYRTYVFRSASRPPTDETA